MIPFKNYFDRKGPYLFLINSIPFLFNSNRNGLFVLQCLSLFLTSFFLFITVRKFTNSINAFLSVLFSYPFLGCYYAEGNQCEEWEILFITISVYLVVSFIARRETIANHPPIKHLFMDYVLELFLL